MTKFSISFALVMLFSCYDTKKMTQEVYPKAISFSELTNSSNSGFLAKNQQVITDTDNYNETWGELFSNYMKKPPIPTVNFETKMVVLVAMGEKPNGGYSTQVKTIYETANEVIVTIEEKIPSQNCITTSVIVHPAQLIEMPITSKKIIFKLEENSYKCNE